MIEQIANGVHKLMRPVIVLAMIVATTMLAVVQGQIDAVMMTATTAAVSGYFGLKGAGAPAEKKNDDPKQ